MLNLLKYLLKNIAFMGKKGFDRFVVGNPQSPNVLVFTEHVNATYYISFDIPLNVLNREKALNFAVASQQRVGKKGVGIWERWDREFRPDLVIMTRYGLPYGAEILDYFKERKIPVIYHIDDNLLDIPPSLGAVIKKTHGASDVIETRRYLLENCDLIYASTEYLAQHLQSLYPQQKIFSGMYAPYMAEHICNAEKPDRDHQTIGYMGSRGHQEDLQQVVPSLIRLLDDNPTVRFEVFGSIKMPTELIRFGKRVKAHEVSTDYIGFLKRLARLNWDIGLAPLANEKFNLCKAPTKFVEYTAAGIPVIASDILVYNRIAPQGSALLVREDWYVAINSLLKDPQLRVSMVKNARSYCANNFSEKRLQTQLSTLINETIR
jgi:glycosyltransferase involved in cell wall biosynthesis